MNDQPNDDLEKFGAVAGMENVSVLQAFDRVVAMVEPRDPLRHELLAVREGIADQEEMISDARQMIEKLEEVIKKVTSPANRIGTFLGSPSRDTAHIVVGGSDYYCNVDPRIALKDLKKGTRVLVNEAYVVVGDLGFETAGPVTKITEVLGGDRLRVGGEHGLQSTILQRSAQLTKTTLKSGDEVRVDPGYRMALEALARPDTREHYLDDVPELPWEKVGGQDEALQAIKDAIELPLIHGDLFQKFQHATPKGFLLHGPPGCGKTLIGKATAYNLTRQLREKTGNEMKEYFMHVKGPEILNMWVGESERIVRDIFSTARENDAKDFCRFCSSMRRRAFSERDARPATRTFCRLSCRCSAQRWTGFDSLDDVVIILASNRADLIDPAILRPGRIDRKIKVNRPNRAERVRFTDLLSTDAFRTTPDVLLVETRRTPRASKALLKRLLETQFARREENKFSRSRLLSGRKEILYRSDLFSGAIIASIVERAKSTAIKRAIAQSETRESAKPICRQRSPRSSRRTHLPARRYHRGLVQADRLRSGKCGEDRANPRGRGVRAHVRRHLGTGRKPTRVIASE
jgi:proteasome-associated ATPase